MLDKKNDFTIVIQLLLLPLIVLIVFYIINICKININLSLIYIIILFKYIFMLASSRKLLRLGILESFLFVILIGTAILYPFEDFNPDSLTLYRNTQRQIDSGWNFVYDPSGRDFALSTGVDSKLWDTPTYVAGSMKLVYAFRTSVKFFGDNASYFVNAYFVWVMFILIIRSKWLQSCVGKKIINLNLLLMSACSPVLITQFFSFYVDLIPQILTLIAIVSICERKLVNNSQRINLQLDTITLLTALLLCNSKLTGMIGAIIVAVVWMLNNKSRFSDLTKIMASLKLIVILSISVVIFQLTYNHLNFGNLLYPISGNLKSGLAGSAVIYENGNISSFFQSSLGIPSINDESLRAPFWVKDFSWDIFLEDDLRESLGAVDTRVAGFGFFFGLIYVYSSFIAFKHIILNHKIDWLRFGILSILLSTPLLPGSYWARLISFLYPFVWCSLLLEISRVRNYAIPDVVRKRKLIVKMPLYILTINSLLAIYFSQINVLNSNKEFQIFMEKARALHQKNNSIVINAKDSEIPYILSQELNKIVWGNCKSNQEVLVFRETETC